MEFTKLRAVKALLSTGNKSMEDAAEWLINHQDDKDIDEPLKIETEEEHNKRIKEQTEKAKELIKKK